MDEDNGKLLTVAQVHELTGITAAQLKNWDKEGVLVARRSGEGIANNRKLYTMDDVRRAQEILLYRKLGFSLDRIKEVFAAPESERALLVAMRTDELKEDYAYIQKQIELSSALEVVGPDSLMDELVDVEGPDRLIDAYERDKNLRQWIRWSRSHTDRDIEKINAELQDALDNLVQIPDDATWELVKAHIARFCDAWSKPFGWPTVGQMLAFHFTFAEMAENGENADGLFDAEACESLAEAFRLAWASSALKCMEDVLAVLYWNACGGVSLEPVHETAKVLRAAVAEFSYRPHMSDGKLMPEQSTEFVEITRAIFELLEEVALDERLERYLHLDEFYAVDGPGLETARHITEAWVEGRLESWLSDGGASEIEQRIDAWIDALRLQWERVTHDGSQTDCPGSLDEEEQVERFSAWVEEHYACTFADPPEARWSSEEEDCTVEKRTRDFAQRMVSEGKMTTPD